MRRIRSSGVLIARVESTRIRGDNGLNRSYIAGSCGGVKFSFTFVRTSIPAHFQVFELQFQKSLPSSHGETRELEKEKKLGWANQLKLAGPSQTGYPVEPTELSRFYTIRGSWQIKWPSLAGLSRQAQFLPILKQMIQTELDNKIKVQTQ